MKIFYLIGSYDIAIRLSSAKIILFKVRVCKYYGINLL